MAQLSSTDIIAETKRANDKEKRKLKPDDIEILTDMTREQWNALADTKLQELLQTSSGALLLAVIRESKDRIEGKPAQTLQVDATLRQITVNATIKFADEIPVSRDKLIIDHVDKPQTIDSK